MKIITNDTARVSPGMVQGHMALLNDYRRTLRTACDDLSYATPESCLATTHDERALAEALELANRFAGVRTILLVGIGGSDLGTRAVYDALRGYGRTFSETDAPRIYSFGTVEPSVAHAARGLINGTKDPDDLVLIVISKSGTTTETITNANLLFAAMEARFGAAKAAERTVVISDPDAPLASVAHERSFVYASMPKGIGGRYSVFTAVGLVPLALAGIDVAALTEGALRGARAVAPAEGPSSAAMLAALIFESYLGGTELHEHFFFHPELETLGKWYRQLLAESLGKERADGTKVGIMPTVAIGSVDLHSLGQLVFGGPANRFTTFVASPAAWESTDQLDEASPFMLPMLANKNPADVMRAIYGGVREAYVQHGLPFVRIELSQIDAGELGAFMALQIGVIMYLAQLLDVNAFDQPNVELYKKETRRLLQDG